MSRPRSVRLVSFWIMVAFAYLLALRHDRQIQLQRQQLFGHYSERDVMKMATPIIEAILPNRNDLYLTAEHGKVVSANDRLKRLWSVDCLDGQGNNLIHIGRDAESGRLCWISCNIRPDPTPAWQRPLSPRTAAVEAQRWLRTMGDQEAWTLKGVPQYRARKLTFPIYFVTLERPGWHAHVSLDTRSGTLMFADILPTR